MKTLGERVRMRRDGESRIVELTCKNTRTSSRTLKAKTSIVSKRYIKGKARRDGTRRWPSLRLRVGLSKERKN